MAVLASKTPYNASLGMGPNQPSVISPYAVNYGHQKPSGGPASHNAPFLSPTESEFSESRDSQDSIRYVLTLENHLLRRSVLMTLVADIFLLTGPGMRSVLASGCAPSTALSMRIYSKVRKYPCVTAPTTPRRPYQCVHLNTSLKSN